MRWETKEAMVEDTRTIKKFAWRKTICDDGYTCWLEFYYVNQVYRRYLCSNSFYWANDNTSTMGRGKI